MVKMQIILVTYFSKHGFFHIVVKNNVLYLCFNQGINMIIFNEPSLLE